MKTDTLPFADGLLSGGVLACLLALAPAAGAIEKKDAGRSFSPAEQKQQRALQQRYGQQIVGTWAASQEECRSAPRYKFKAGGSLRGHEIEGLWRLNGSALFLVAFELTTRTEETGRSGVHTAWWVKYYIETLDASVLSLQHAEKGWRHRYVRCKSTAG